MTTTTQSPTQSTNPGVSAANTSKKAAIVEAAVTCFSRDGFGGTTIAAVATQAGIGKGTVYEYFRSKEELLIDACLWCCQQNQKQVNDLLGSTGPGVHSGSDASPAKALHRLVLTAFTVIPESSRTFIRLFTDLWTVASDQPQVLARAQSMLRESYAQWEAVVNYLYGAGLAQGTFRPLPDPTILGRLFTASIDGLVWQIPFRPERTAEAVARSAADGLLTLLMRDSQHPPEVFA
jgi:AcrR family transcriptional regulator